MEMDSDDETLRSLAAGNPMDYSTWPLLLSTIISRLDKIAKNDFPIPRIPEPASPVAPSPQEPRFLAPLPSSDALEPPPSSAPNQPTSEADSSQDTNKENAAPTPPTSAPAPPPAPAPSAAATSAPEPGTLPPQIVAMIAEINGVLNESFHTYPPHTIQRLAELILGPRQHYKSLPSYLHAVDRVVHVTSGNNTYPLPPAIPDMSSMTLGVPNGVMDQGHGNHESGPDTSMAWVSTSNGNAIGSDEALGGALLTPIPWLQRRSSGNRDGDGGSESGESSTLGSDGGPSPLASNQSPAASSSSPSQRSSSQQSSRQFETRTESTETIDGPNGVGSIETVSISVNGIPPMGSAAQQRVITQGELIRQEQRAGVVPVSQLQRSGPVVVTSSSSAEGATASPADDGSSTDAADNDTPMGEAGAGAEGEQPKDTSSDRSDEEMPDEEEAPHARGPDHIGAADMGPQAPASSSFSLSSGGNMEVRGIDVEAAVGRKHEAAPAPAAAETPDSSDDGAAIMTPASSSEGGGDDATKEEAADKTAAEQQQQQQQQDKETKTSSSSSSPGTLSARASPTPSSKRGAEDDEDAGAAGGSHKRLKEDAGDDPEAKPEAKGPTPTPAGEQAEASTTAVADKDAAPSSSSAGGDDDDGAKKDTGKGESGDKTEAAAEDSSTAEAGDDSAA
ncbi:hypothetical protein KVR01_010233 [Diaporthe batatas]|uniref:uncharacterized protein n=1 Tax=Diaporthe batatas TaxID=748121 RepID=UPI001D04BAAA|nr:uncharacterized protein KVR01_010233 [Diaporthe batatas]KAG8159596.1 hypothetical protein KVR01_010233 [Diaporthe batatas]